ncbi:MAG: hypothetical protein Kow0022_06460 [Phycisphaerales bacterium]
MGGLGGSGAAGGVGDIASGAGGAGDAQGKDDPVASPAGASVSEELVWKARAIRAETRVSELEQRIAEIESQLEQLRAANARAERERELEVELGMAEAIDIETARLLAEHLMAADESMSIADAVAHLRQTKPFLFRTSPRRTVMSGQVTPSGRDVLEDLADEARSSGDRTALLRYLRARRGA